MGHKKCAYKFTEIINEELVPKVGSTVDTLRIRIWFAADSQNDDYTDLTWEQLDKIHCLAKPH